MIEKIYCGYGREFGKYGQIGINVCLDDIPDKHITVAKNGKRYVNLNIGTKRNKDQYGNTLSVSVNTWKPDNQ